MSDLASESAAPRMLTHAQARDEQRKYWASKTPAERIAAATELKRRSLAILGINLDDRKADFTISRIPRRRG
jgi:hypothetical protein